MKAVRILMMGEKATLEFVTNKNGTFTPAITSINTATWNVTGETPQVTNSPSFALDGTERIVTMTISDFSSITVMNFADENIKGSIDLSLFTGCSDFRINTNAELTSITNPVSSTVLTRYHAFSCDITGTFSFSGMSGLGGNFQIFSNPNMTGLTLPTSSTVFTFLYAYSCNITGTLDMSGLTGLAGDVVVRSNANMTGLLLPSTSQAFTRIWAYSCALGIIDWSPLSGVVPAIRIENNAFTTTESNTNIDDIDTNVNLTTSLNIAGTNAALTTGPPDGIAAKDNLIVEGVSVTWN